MKKIVIFLKLLILSIFIATIYGIIHDQITFSISNEYFTKFKFIQFGLIEDSPNIEINNPRLYVSLVGVIATWWTGLIAGIILGIIGLFYKQSNILFLKSILIIIITAIIFGFIGYVYSNFFINLNQMNWILPDNVILKKNFIIVGFIHGFSYLGSLIGLLISIVYLLKNLLRNKV